MHDQQYDLATAFVDACAQSEQSSLCGLQFGLLKVALHMPHLFEVSDCVVMNPPPPFVLFMLATGVTRHLPPSVRAREAFSRLLATNLIRSLLRTGGRGVAAGSVFPNAPLRRAPT